MKRIAILLYQGDVVYRQGPLRGGVWRYGYSLAHALLRLDAAYEYTVVHGVKSEESFAGLEHRQRLIPLSGLRRLFVLPRMLEGQYDLVHETTNFCPWFSGERIRRVVTVHDVTPLVYPKTADFKSYLFYRIYLPRALKRMDAIIVPSVNTKNDIVRLYGVRDACIHVIPYGVEEAFRQEIHPGRLSRIRERWHLHGPYILFVGGINYHKNINVVLKAYALLPQDLQDTFQVVVVGGYGASVSETLDLITRLGLQERVVLCGHVKEEDLIPLYKGAYVFVFPSLYEGFGFPPLEAMAAGCPVVASNAASLPEVVGDGGILVDPKDADAWHDALLNVLVSPSLRMQLQKRGSVQAQKFTWRRSAEEHLKVYQSFS